MLHLWIDGSTHACMLKLVSVSFSSYESLYPDDGLFRTLLIVLLILTCLFYYNHV